MRLFKAVSLVMALLREGGNVFGKKVHVSMSGPIDECNIRMNIVLKGRFSESNAVVLVALIWQLVRERKVNIQSLLEALR